MELNVTKLDVRFKSKKSQLADVKLQADLHALLPGGNDVVALYLDGAPVFAAPFSQFEPAKSQARSGVYQPLDEKGDRHFTHPQP